MTSQETLPVSHNQPEYSVSELSGALKRVVEGSFSHVRVRGEISGFKRAASGHLYLDLKDDKAVLGAVCWKGVAATLSIKPEDGMEVICTGRLSTYPGRSNYQLIIEQMELAGVGALMALLEKRRQQLSAEGLFAPERKRALPFFPRVIGVVTSPTGAVIRDILHRLSERCPAHVLVWPVAVQGKGAEAQIAAAIEGFNRLSENGSPPRPDVLIVARGGGSLEDLWAFNEEIVVRAAATSTIPLISAVGHETDTTLIDFAADKRAPTPTAAAEIATPVLADLRATLHDLGQRAERAALRHLEWRRERLEAMARGLLSPARLLELRTQRADELSMRLERAAAALVQGHGQRLEGFLARLRPSLLTQQCQRYTERLENLGQRLDVPLPQRLWRAQDRLEATSRMLEALSHRSVLRRGFAYVTDEAGALIASAGGIGNTPVRLHFQDGVVPVVRSGGDTKPLAAKPKRSKVASAPNVQQSLFQ